jgi:hypothetical protein
MRLTKAANRYLAPAAVAATVAMLCGVLGYARDQSQTTMANTSTVPTVPGTGAISGLVVDRATNQPVAGALVELGPRIPAVSDQSRRQLTDSKGRFIFSHLAPYAGYSLSASKGGYLRANFGSPPAEIQAAIALADAQWVRDVHLLMSRAGSISGVVVDDRGEPIVNAYVRVLSRIPIGGEPQLAAGSFARTDDRGAYRIAGLPRGTYYVQMPSVQNAFSAATTDIALAGTVPFDLSLAASTGRTIAFADPIMDADANPNIQTVIGRYPVPPRGADGRLMVYPVTFAPGPRTIAEATPIDLGAGEFRVGVDLHVAALSSATLAGVIHGPPESYTGLTVRLLVPGTEDLGEGSEAATALVDAGARFTFVNVPAGSYVLQARGTAVEYQFATSGTPDVRLPRGPGVLVGTRGANVTPVNGLRLQMFGRTGDDAGSGYWARETLTTDGHDRFDLVLSMRKGVTIAGRFVIEGATPRTADTLFATPAHGTAGLGFAFSHLDLGSADRFAITGLVPGEYILTSGRLKSVVCGGRDYTHRPIDASAGTDISDCIVAFTDQVCRATGAVRGEQGAAPADTAVIAFPVERELWTRFGPHPARIRTAAVTPAGLFTVALPAGRYYLIAVPARLSDAWQSDASFFEQAAAQATEIHLEWGAKVSQDLTVKSLSVRMK